MDRNKQIRYWDNLSEIGKRQVFLVLMSDHSLENQGFIEKQIEEFDRLYSF